MLARPASCLGQATVEKGGIQFGALLYLIKRLHKSLSTFADDLFQWNFSSVKDKLFSFQNTSHFFSVILNGYLLGIRETIFWVNALHPVTLLEQGVPNLSAPLAPPQAGTYFGNTLLLGCYRTHLSQT
jgi:hypothetical protein